MHPFILGRDINTRFPAFSLDWKTLPGQQIKTTEYSGNVNTTDNNAHCLHWANLTKEKYALT
jgi:hypothetical protein